MKRPASVSEKQGNKLFIWGPVLLLVLLVCAGGAWADSFPNLGAAGPQNWGILQLGGGQVSLNGPTAGVYGSATQANVGIGNGGKLNSSGTTIIQGTYYRYTGGPNDSVSQTTFSGGKVQSLAANSLLNQAVLDAQAAYSAAIGLTCTFGASCGTALNVSHAVTTITGTSGLNVLSFSSAKIDHGSVTLSGSASSQFVILIANGMTLNSGSFLLGGSVNPFNVLYVITGNGKTASASGGGNASVLNGILFNLNGKIQFSPGAVNGSVIGGKDISFVSGGNVNVPLPPAPPPPPVPEPATFFLVGSGLAACVARLRNRMQPDRD